MQDAYTTEEPDAFHTFIRDHGNDILAAANVLGREFSQRRDELVAQGISGEELELRLEGVKEELFDTYGEEVMLQFRAHLAKHMIYHGTI